MAPTHHVLQHRRRATLRVPRRLLLAGTVFASLTLLLTACPSLPPPDRLAFDSDPRILRGAYLGTVDTRKVPWYLELTGDASLLAAGWDDVIDVWDTATAGLITSIPLETNPYGDLGGLSLDATGALVATLQAGNVRLWNARDGAFIRTLDPGDLLGACTYCGIYSMALSPGGDLVAASGREPLVLLFSTTTGDVVHQLPTRGDMTGPVFFSSDGSQVSAFSSLSDTSYLLRVWNTATYTLVFEHEGTVSHDRYPRFAASADGRRLAVGSATKVEVFDLGGGRTVLSLDEAQGGWFVALNHDGTQLAIVHTVGASSSLEIIDIATGTLLMEFTDVLRGQPMWSADGRYLIADAKLANATDFAVVQDFAVGHLYGLELQATPTYVDERSYTVAGSLSIDGGAPFAFTGAVHGQESQRYLQPQARLPYPATLTIELDEPPWLLNAYQRYSLDYWNASEPESWQGDMLDGTSAAEAWYPFRLWRVP